MTSCITEGTFHWQNLMWHSTASVAGQLEHWLTAWCREIPTSGLRATGNSGWRHVGKSWHYLGEKCPSLRVILTPIWCTVLWTHQVHIQMASRLVWPFLHGSLSLQTDRPTDRPRYTVCNNRPHLASAAMRPNKALSRSPKDRIGWF